MTKLGAIRNAVENKLDEAYKAMPPMASSSLEANTNYKAYIQITAQIKAYRYILEQIRFLEENKTLLDPELRQ